MIARREGLGEERVKEFGICGYTLLQLKWITNRVITLKHMELCSILCVNLDGRGV